MRDLAKLVLALVGLFLLDLIKLFGSSLSVEFLFLGIIFVSLNRNLWISLTLSIIFGYFKSCLIPEAGLLSLIGFPIVCLFINYFSMYIPLVNKRITLIWKGAIVSLAIIAHIVFNFISTGLLLPVFYLHFFIQSFVFFLLIAYLFRKVIVVGPPEFTK